MVETHTFTKGEEIANAITHGIGTLLSIAALVLLVVFSALNGTAWHIVTFSIYGATMLILYLSSTMLHSFPKGKAKSFFEICDHASIYLFIAGTYTPITLIVIQGSLGWVLFGTVWALAIGGVVFKVFFVKKFNTISTLLYIVMGWLVVFGFNKLLTTLPPMGIVFLVIGGVLYTLGTIFYLWRAFPYHHAVWHLFVLAGSIFHFFAVLLYVLPIQF
ncbi:PAQR family membrane homeostasis protein TrhA [Bacillus solimangrovi]|uniref:Hemolysin D n=1 Tax=Bacillus solimangrovi TaxID=1305675 RepID=A0A1E5LGF7_9BACI|nr:hemolysin III family protein [Bacillus solimangrovi]OEH93136.1 hemolysin D [Bacillus solimangrovi]